MRDFLHRVPQSGLAECETRRAVGKHYRDVRQSVFGSLPVGNDTALVLRCLEPIWSKIPETASRLRGRIGTSWAKVRGYRIGENRLWKGHLKKLLPTLSTKGRVIHHKAMPFGEVEDLT
jgi:hypothetical protein